MRRTPMRFTPMTYPSMRYMPVRYMPIRYIPVRYTPTRYKPIEYILMGCISVRYPSRDGSEQSHQAFRHSVTSIVVSASAFLSGVMSFFALLTVLAALIFVIQPIIERAILEIVPLDLRYL
jgi:hypothetical protein